MVKKLTSQGNCYMRNEMNAPYKINITLHISYLRSSFIQAIAYSTASQLLYAIN